MSEKFWFNRMAEYWSWPSKINLVEFAKRADLQLIQIGDFGPIFYGLADTEWVQSFVGMPVQDIRESLDYMTELTSALQSADVKVIGQMSMSWHYGDHEQHLGWFGAWEKIWTPDLLGDAPCKNPGDGHQISSRGELLHWPIQGRPYQTYTGCINNPNWVAILKRMVKRAIAIGLDGFNVHHNFVGFCACSFCQERLRPFLAECFEPAELTRLFGTSDLSDVEDVVTARSEWPEPLSKRFSSEVDRLAHLTRKKVFDDIYIHYGRNLKPGLILAQWYHKYDFSHGDERSRLPSDLWAKDEDYIWYSQGSLKGRSYLQREYLGDVTLPAKYVYAMGGGKPFVLNKYVLSKWRLSIAEAAANHAAALGVHWDDTFPLEDYLGPVIRYHSFLSRYQDLYHPAETYSDIALIYPRRAEIEGEDGCNRPFKRLGWLLENRHLLFDIVLDEQISPAKLSPYSLVILPDIRYLSDAEGEVIRNFVSSGGSLIATGDTGTCDVDGVPRRQSLLSDMLITSQDGDSMGRSTFAKGKTLYIPDVPWDVVQVVPESYVNTPPLIENDQFGNFFLRELRVLLPTSYLETDAPWYVRVSGWQQQYQQRILLHWVNYNQDEESAIEVPIPTDALTVTLWVPVGIEVQEVEWLYPEATGPVELPFTQEERVINFRLPRLIVYGVAVISWTP